MKDTPVHYVPEHRRGSFKSRYMDTEWDRRKRRDEQVQGIRRRRRDSKMAKLRSIDSNEGGEDGSEGEGDYEEHYGQDQESELDRFACINEKNIGMLKERLYSGEEANQLWAIKLVRDVLSNEDPPIQNVLDAQLLPRLVQLLASKDSRVQYEAAWAVTNVASGTTAQTKSLVDCGGIQALCAVLKTASSLDYILANQVVWALGNIAGEHWQYRDWILEQGVMEAVALLIHHLPPDQNVTWALTNFCRGQELESQWGRLRPLLPEMRSLLYLGENAGVSDTAWALYGLCSTIKEPAIHAIEQQNIVMDLCKLLDSRSVSVRVPVLRTLGACLDCAPRINNLCHNFGILTRIETILTDPNCSSLHQDAFFVLSNIAQHGTAAQVTEMLQRTIVYVLRAMSSSHDYATKTEACWVVRNSLVNHEMTPQLAQLNLVDKGVISPLCKLLEPKSDNIVLKLCLESLRQVLRNGSAKMTDGINVLAVYISQLGGAEKLQNVIYNSRNNEIYDLAGKILDQHFDV